MDPTDEQPPANGVASPASDREAGFAVGADFRRFSQKDDIFCRSFWDAEVRSDRSDMFYETYRTPKMKWRSVDGFTQRDYALRNASWHVTDIFAELREDDDRREGFLDLYTVMREGPGSALPVASPETMAREVKQSARVLGADLVGITGYDERWMYTHAYSRETETEKPQEIPHGLDNVVVIAQSMDRGLLRTAPSALSGAATGATYSRDTIVLLAIAQYITNLGYRAVASMNDSALVIPLAIKAGLGEYGPPRPPHNARVRAAGTDRQGLHRHAPRARPARPIRRQGGVRHLPRMHGRVPGEGHRRGRAVHPGPQPLEHPGHPQVDDRRREVLPLLGQSEHGLLDLRPRVPVQPGFR